MSQKTLISSKKRKLLHNLKRLNQTGTLSNSVNIKIPILYQDQAPGLNNKHSSFPKLWISTSMIQTLRIAGLLPLGNYFTPSSQTTNT